MGKIKWIPNDKRTLWDLVWDSELDGWDGYRLGALCKEHGLIHRSFIGNTATQFAEDNQLIVTKWPDSPKGRPCVRLRSKGIELIKKLIKENPNFGIQEK